ncbi:hypothetical protein HMPREF1544_03635 [Mucor circinelloides 1006PhL]|uniref:STAS domain-containing protein n=1 Tax=Mucor circinelloides f. circinelloides (strain 1006PhL) TaxID=1220926 RepID=S2JGX0_MUCC1|nr:hypothetical protein HMPREF1544_03635 [Mucor circinelloides 1006PhL]
MKDTAIVIDYTPVPFKIKAKAFLRQLPNFFKAYFASIFPILQWIHRYNLTWLVQDVIAGVTVGIVIVPQSMAYAKIANLDPQYGLYTSFVGVTLYCFFGTSKDISIGPISTVSLLVSSVVNSVIKIDPSITPSEIAVTLGLFAGIIMVVISFLRLGILVDFIPEPAIAGYMTGSAITIVLSQCPKLFGIPDVSTHESPYLIFGNVLAKLPHTQLDVAFGLVSLVFLYTVRFACGRYTAKSPALQKAVFLFGIMRNGLIVIVGSFISFMICRGKSTNPISVIQSVPAGFDAMGIPKLRFDILQEAGGIFPSIILILILEHISVAKSFGRIYDYQINPDQEILAIGVSNIVGSFFGGYPATGAFSRTAIMARSGARTPIAGVFSGAIVVLALYALTPAFYYIPDAVLAAVVIHAVSDLASGSKYLKELWHASSAEFFVWVSAVLVTIFVDVETGIYAAVGLSLILMLYRFARPPIRTLTRISTGRDDKPATNEMYLDAQGNKTTTDVFTDKDKHYVYVDETDPNFKDFITPVPSGTLILKLCDSILYPNAEHISDAIVHTVKQKTRCGNTADMNKSDSDRAWNHSSQAHNFDALQLPVLEALILDFSAVCRLDATALQILATTRDTVDRYAGSSVEWHFTGIQSESVRRALLHAGFGSYCALSGSESSGNCSLVSLASANDHQIPSSSAIASPKLPMQHIVVNHQEGLESRNFIYDLETGSATNTGVSGLHACNSPSNAPCTPTDRFPCFHWDVDSAVRSVCKRWHDKAQKMEKIDTGIAIN